ncbi:MAG: glycosyltransferase [Chitinophagaceae bacterium]|nr:glycosyltransferase [Chitinophagaceae bacterium]
MKIAFVTTYDARNILNWSGSSYYISKSLEDQHNDLKYIGNLKRIVSPIDKIKKINCRIFSNKDFVLDRTVAVSKKYCEQVEEQLKLQQCDCIFSIGSIEMAYLKTKIPKIFYTDATFASMIDYYKGFMNLSPEIIRQGHRIEKQALENCTLAIYSSEWAANSARDFYGINKAKIKVVPLGANMEIEYSKTEINEFINKKTNASLKILFNGVDWERKGGDMVVQTVKEIHSRGINVQLHLVGGKTPDIGPLPDFITDHGFLNKSVAREKAILTDLYTSCHFLFVPSYAEAFGLVFCEASAHGTPSIARNTGGIPSIISNGKNGFLLNPENQVQHYADVICENYHDKKKYYELALSSYNEFSTRLNWNTSGGLLSGIIRAAVNDQS